MKANEADLTKFKGTIGSVFKANRDALLSVKSSQEAFDLVSKLFNDNGINTPKSRQILMKLRNGMNYIQTVTYLNNILMKAQGLGILDSEVDELKKPIKESESSFSTIGSITSYYCKDMIMKDAPDDSDLKVAEIYFNDFIPSANRQPVQVDDADYQTLKKQYSKDADAYRFIVYYVDATYDTKWYDAVDNIACEYDFERYVNPDDDQWKEQPNEYPAEFAKTFKTYADWKKHLEEECSEKLKHILSTSGKLPYESVADEVKVNDDGVAYVIIGWRA